MTKTIKVNIGGTDYSLTGEDEELMRNAADLVNENIKSIKTAYKSELPLATVQALVSLNFAENEILTNMKNNSEDKLLAEQLSKMVEYLESILKN